MRDELFIRGEVPMTKAEVRAVSISKLELHSDSILYDVGAGTGSVSVEASRWIKEGRIYAVERKPEAAALIRANQEKFHASQIQLVEGTAPEALEGLEMPTHVFIGGSGGNMKEIVALVLEKNPSVRVVLNIIALESLAELLELLKERNMEAEIVQLQVAKGKAAGACHLMLGQNPVYIVSFGGIA